MHTYQYKSYTIRITRRLKGGRKYGFKVYFYGEEIASMKTFDCSTQIEAGNRAESWCDCFNPNNMPGELRQ